MNERVKPALPAPGAPVLNAVIRGSSLPSSVLREFAQLSEEFAGYFACSDGAAEGA
ncbi:hypothetical protein [Streptomyces roseoverticillatus]|uniref:Uncharacterized protein n=1 Tax=Streptomyces roseoverticillatus TaxID=66429 RepID=A0ABV3J1K0_9ACTN